MTNLLTPAAHARGVIKERSDILKKSVNINPDLFLCFDTMVTYAMNIYMHLLVCSE